MATKFTIPGRLDGLNEYIDACRNNKYQANTMKRNNQFRVYLAFRGAKIKKVEKYPVELKITWYEQNSRRDVDNICFAVKFILDALVSAKIIENDSQKYVKSIRHTVAVDKKNPRVEVEICSV